MVIKTRHIGTHSKKNGVAAIIELIISANNTNMIVEITDLDSHVDEDFIEKLRDLANELEDHNIALDE